MDDKRLLIVDDSRDNLELLSVLLERNGWEFDTASSGTVALQHLTARSYALVITDLMMPGINGIELLEKIKESWGGTEVIIVTAYGSIPTAVEAMRKGAYSYLLRPFEPEEVALSISKIFELQSMRSENRMLREEINRTRGFEKIVGQGFSMTAVFQLIDTVSATNSTVLILGESGSGKELIARAIHNKSPRADHPFVKVSCAALSEGLLESELFGHEKGSFTGAHATHKGRFELANKGTLFLDEIGEISPAVQVKLLRAIQEREFERVGGTQTITTDTRIISATNKNLAEEVKEGRFREDLYYRLNVISIEPPPLRERREDIPLLAYHFLEKYRAELNREVNALSDEALASLSSYQWPGNVRELQNVIERAVVLGQGRTLDLADLPDVIQGSAPRSYIPQEDYELSELPPLKEARAQWEKKFVENALGRFEGNITHTAQAIGIARKNLQEKIKTYQIETHRKTTEQASHS